MGFDIDFLPVGDESQSGDAIIIRYGDLLSEPVKQKVILIDGGFKDTSKKIINHIYNIYKTNTIDLIISTHPDQDHASGLTEVIEKMNIKEIWMHRPWKHAKVILPYLKDSRWTIDGLKKHIKDNYTYAFDVEQAAIKKNLMPIEPFEGRLFDNGVIKILSPSYEWYLLYLLNFDKMPEPLDNYKMIRKTVLAEVKKAINWIQEKWDDEKLTDPAIGDTPIENESSSIIYFRYDNKKVLFTSDAGIHALNQVVKYSNKCSIDISNLDLMQIPHHGSIHNIGPTVLNKILGKPVAKGTIKKGFGIASVSTNSDQKHPSKRVTNAYNRRGYEPYKTEGTQIMWNINSNRKGYPIDPIPFYEKVEDD